MITFINLKDSIKEEISISIALSNLDLDSIKKKIEMVRLVGAPVSIQSVGVVYINFN